MSIKGIDAQIMVTRTAEVAKDSASLAHKSELFQSQMAAIGKSQDAQDSRSVVRRDKAEKASVNKDGESGAGYQGQEGERKEKKRPDPNESLSAGFPGEHKIDIKI